jgi:hypothetical protein
MQLAMPHSTVGKFHLSMGGADKTGGHSTELQDGSNAGESMINMMAPD